MHFQKNRVAMMGGIGHVSDRFGFIETGVVVGDVESLSDSPLAGCERDEASMRLSKFEDTGVTRLPALRLLWSRRWGGTDRCCCCCCCWGIFELRLELFSNRDC